ncbi:histidine triad (HIT) protein [Melioribacter roseus P3M-2]|uniref:Histidine triad (HIT) protein n=1 Tax=Melioribacter roseus (strain DSM 23840 / JCM 17771 / VKM B-2668 / P3M-2) TaxID=1191523 RepID=I6YYM1_MELRP|nr:histidine triad nucleotide-binding protein [Melioribacter roseus]AFN75672.1 histidine triad (HIT) protein [Melioribacter roseus P3M-2]
MGETIFSKIIRKEIPADIVYEGDTVLAFRDINPQAPVHVLIIPKITDIETAKDINPAEHGQLLADMFEAANKIAKDLGVSESGYRLVINSGRDAGQEVYHLHMHLLGGRKLNWPPG